MAKADLGNAKRLYPSVFMDEADWVRVITNNPDIMWKIVGDIYNAVKDEENREAGIRRVGRRPSREATSLDDVWATVFPTQFTMDPFPVALTKLIGDRSMRAFAAKVPVHHSTLVRLRNGVLEPDIQMLEAVAVAGKVSPHYFIEWRAMFVGQLITRVLLQQPNMGITALRQVRTGRREQEEA